MLLVPSSSSTMYSRIAVALALLATVGPAVSIPNRASPSVSLGAPQSTSTVAAIGNDIDNTSARQLGMSLPVLNMGGDQTYRRREEPTENFLELLARGDGPAAAPTSGQALQELVKQEQELQKQADREKKIREMQEEENRKMRERLEKQGFEITKIA